MRSNEQFEFQASPSVCQRIESYAAFRWRLDPCDNTSLSESVWETAIDCDLRSYRNANPLHADPVVSETVDRHSP
jgi:hypothetical protein